MIDFDIFLVFDGNCREVLDFYTEIFAEDFELRNLMTFGELDENLIPSEGRNKIMFAEFKLFGKTVLLSDCANFYHPYYVEGTNMMLSFAMHDEEKIKKLFTALSKEGKTIYGLADTAVTDMLGIVIDKFGITWQMSLKPKGQKLSW